MQDGVLAEGGRAHEMVDGLSVHFEPGLAVTEHNAFSCCRSHFRTQIGLARLAHLAFPALSLVAWNHVVSGTQIFHSFAHTLYYSAMNQNSSLSTRS